MNILTPGYPVCLFVISHIFDMASRSCFSFAGGERIDTRDHTGGKPISSYQLHVRGEYLKMIVADCCPMEGTIVTTSPTAGCITHIRTNVLQGDHGQI